MYRHTTPTPAKYLVDNDPEGASRMPLLSSGSGAAESVWGDYPGKRTGAGRYVDLNYAPPATSASVAESVVVGRLWGNDKTVGLLHLPLAERHQDRYEAEIQHWNAAMQIRLSYHLGVPAAEAFDAVAAKFDHGPIVEGDIKNINYPDVDAIFYVDRYDPTDTYIWCEEMK